jgi:hypothetical protein
MLHTGQTTFLQITPLGDCGPMWRKKGVVVLSPPADDFNGDSQLVPGPTNQTSNKPVTGFPFRIGHQLR